MQLNYNLKNDIDHKKLAYFISSFNFHIILYRLVVPVKLVLMVHNYFSVRYYVTLFTPYTNKIISSFLHNTWKILPHSKYPSKALNNLSPHP